MSKVTTVSPPKPLSLQKLEAATGRPLAVPHRAVAVYLLLDCSGSMATGSKMDDARSGAKEFAEKAIRAGYAVGLIQFATTPHHAFSPQTDLAGFDAALRAFHPVGGTNIDGAIHLAIQQLDGVAGEKVICIVTDGQPDRPKATLAAATEARRRKIDIMAIGTDDADRDFLAQITTRKELAVTVARQEFRKAISSMALMLPAPDPKRRALPCD